MANVVVEGTSVTASQLKEFFSKVEAGAITRKTLQAFLERRNPFVRIVDLYREVPIIEKLKKLDEKHLDWDGWYVHSHSKLSGQLSSIDLDRVKFKLGSPSMTVTGIDNLPTGEDRLRYMNSLGLVMLDAHCLIAILEHQDSIPDSWTELWGHMVFFGGTILKSRAGNSFILDITCDKGKWYLHRTSLTQHFHNGLSVAVYE